MTERWASHSWNPGALFSEFLIASLVYRLCVPGPIVFCKGRLYFHKTESKHYWEQHWFFSSVSNWIFNSRNHRKMSVDQSFITSSQTGSQKWKSGLLEKKLAIKNSHPSFCSLTKTNRFWLCGHLKKWTAPGFSHFRI